MKYIPRPLQFTNQGHPPFISNPPSTNMAPNRMYQASIKLLYRGPNGFSSDFTLREQMRIRCEIRRVVNAQGKFHITAGRNAHSNPRLFIFELANKEQADNIFNDDEFQKLYKDLGFLEPNTTQSERAKAARRVYVRNLDSQLFAGFINDEQTLEECEEDIMSAIGEEIGGETPVEEVRVHKPWADHGIPQTMLVTFCSVSVAETWVNTNSKLDVEYDDGSVENIGFIYAKFKKMDTYVSLDCCRVCRVRNCTTSSRTCTGKYRCAKCLMENCKLKYKDCHGRMNCIHCGKHDHTSGSIKCPINREYVKRKRTELQNRNRDREEVDLIRDELPPAEARNQIYIRKHVQQIKKQVYKASYADTVARSTERLAEDTGLPTARNPTKEKFLCTSALRWAMTDAALHCKVKNYCQETFKTRFTRHFVEAGIKVPYIPTMEKEAIDALWPEILTNDAAPVVLPNNTTIPEDLVTEDHTSPGSPSPTTELVTLDNTGPDSPSPTPLEEFVTIDQTGPNSPPTNPSELESETEEDTFNLSLMSGLTVLLEESSTPPSPPIHTENRFDVLTDQNQVEVETENHEPPLSNEHTKTSKTKTTSHKQTKKRIQKRTATKTSTEHPRLRRTRSSSYTDLRDQSQPEQDENSSSLPTNAPTNRSVHSARADSTLKPIAESQDTRINDEDINEGDGPTQDDDFQTMFDANCKTNGLRIKRNFTTEKAVLYNRNSAQLHLVIKAIQQNEITMDYENGTISKLEMDRATRLSLFYDSCSYTLHWTVDSPKWNTRDHSLPRSHKYHGTCRGKQ